MKTIEIDDEVYTAIERKVEGFNQSPNAVLRKVLSLPEEPLSTSLRTIPSAVPLDEFLRSHDYLSGRTAEDRYLKLIGWLLRNHIELQSKLDGYGLRRRILFSRDRKQIENSGRSVIVKSIPEIGFPFFAMVTLDNSNKRKIIRNVLDFAGYTTTAVVEQALATLRDSGIARGENRRLLDEYASVL